MISASGIGLLTLQRAVDDMRSVPVGISQVCRAKVK